MPSHLRQFFQLDPTVIYLNHGSFGACPRPVFEDYQQWQRELERQPVEFLGRRFAGLLADARAQLAAYVGAAPSDVVFFSNPTTALNMVARSLRLAAGDEVLATTHEYGAMDRMWRFVCGRAQARYVRQPLPLPVSTPAELADELWPGVSENTRAIFLSHITSHTGLVFPVAEVCRRARERGIITIIDGAHAPGQLALDLPGLGCDLYAGACHKWLCAPKGSAFLYARPEVQAWLEPLVVSWGWEDESFEPDSSMGDTRFVRYHQWQGTRDVAAFLATPAAIRFQADHDWARVRADCRALASETRSRIHALTGVAPLCADSGEWYVQMFTARLPASVDAPALKKRLYDEFRIEVPVYAWNGLNLIRVSIQAYNSRADTDALLAALAACV